MTIDVAFTEMDQAMMDFFGANIYAAPAKNKPTTEEKIKQDFSTIKKNIEENHALYSDRALAFYQGGAWALASLDDELEQEYIVMCETVDGRLK